MMRVDDAPLRRLPERYRDEWRSLFLLRVQERMAQGVRILDVGSGRTPVIPAELRPREASYYGLDISADELATAPPDAYDAIIVRDILDYDSSLESRFDVVVSWQALEHVASVPRAFENIRRYLKDGGRAVVQLSGRHSIFAVANRVLPHRVGVRAMERLVGRDPESIFKAHYDHCSYSALQRALSAWQVFEIVPRFRGATYLNFSSPLQSAYLRFENWACSTQKVNLATHYVVVADK